MIWFRLNDEIYIYTYYIFSLVLHLVYLVELSADSMYVDVRCCHIQRWRCQSHCVYYSIQNIHTGNTLVAWFNIIFEHMSFIMKLFANDPKIHELESFNIEKGNQILFSLFHLFFRLNFPIWLNSTGTIRFKINRSQICIASNDDELNFDGWIDC